MVTRIIKLGCLGWLFCVSCTSTPYRFNSITFSETTDVLTFLNLTPEAKVNTAQLKDSYGSYVIVYLPDFQKGVVFDVERDDVRAILVVRNIAFATRLANGGWNLFNQDINGHLYETQGGVWTIQHYADLLEKGLNKAHNSRILGNLVHT